MEWMRVRSLRALFLRLMRFSQRHRGLWLRGTICWLVGLGFLFGTLQSRHDFRFKMRGEKSPSPNIVLVEISEEEWLQLYRRQRSWIRPLKEITHLTDSFYWNGEIWSQILQEILKNDPLAIGVSFYFGNNIRRPLSKFMMSATFQDPRVLWSTRLDGENKPLPTRFGKAYKETVGIEMIDNDPDGVVRRFRQRVRNDKSFSALLASRASEGESSNLGKGSQLINFQGPPGSYLHISLSDLLQGNFTPDFFKNRLVIVGSSGSNTHRTPLGEMTRGELLANMVDTQMNELTISRLGLIPSSAFLLILLVMTIWIIFCYPQSVAIVFLFWLGTLVSALSLWIFDSFCFWTPALASIVQIMVTYMVFLSYQLTQKDNLNWRLEQERKYLLELEQLKDNFVSLISHDLKTPIAKIQAICDRMITQYPGDQISQDLTFLRKESSELHRYIQSILQITRVESRDFKLNKISSDINDLIEKVIDQLTPLAKAKDIEIQTHLEPLFLIEVDSILIREVILNLVENAIKYTPVGGSILVRAHEVGDDVLVEVEDSGIGISDEEQKKIFEKFYRSKSSETTAKGSGLGLYLVKYFIELHGGQVMIDSRLGHGTRVGFSLPVSSEFDTDQLTGEMAWNASLRH